MTSPVSSSFFVRTSDTIPMPRLYFTSGTIRSDEGTSIDGVRSIECFMQRESSHRRPAVPCDNVMKGYLLSSSNVSVWSVRKLYFVPAMSMLLIPCMRYNLEVNKDLYGDVLLYLGQKELYSQTPKEQLGQKAIDYIASLLQTLHEKTNLPVSLGSVENLSEHINEVAEKALNDGALIVNNKYTNKQDIINILEGHYGY